MFDEAFLACLQRIEARLNSDEYESGGIWTVGGPAGNYLIRSPFNTECEWAVHDINSTNNSSNIAGEATRIILTNASTTASFTSADLTVGDLTVLDIDIIFTSFTGGTAPTVQYFVKRKDSAGNYNTIWQPTAVSGATTYTLSIGAAVTNGTNAVTADQSVGLDFGDIIQVGYVTTGTPTSVTQQINIKGKGPVILAPGNGVVAVSAADPTTVPVNPTLGLNTAEDNNAFNGFLVPITYGQSHDVSPHWQPLGRGANLYITITPVSGLAYASIAFRRKLDRAIPAPPRREAHTHSHVGSRRGTRTFAAGFEAQYPRDKYIHEEIPESQDTAAIGNVANVSPAQSLLDKMRNGGR